MRSLSFGMVGYSKWRKVKLSTGPLNGGQGTVFRETVSEIIAAARFGGIDVSLKARMWPSRGTGLPARG